MKLPGMILSLIVVLSGLYSLAQESPGPEATAFLEKVASLDRLGKIEDALKLLDQGVERYKEPNYDRFFTLNYKFTLLLRLNRYEDAVKIAEEKANIIQSPKQALSVAEVFLKLNNAEKALLWIGKSVDRGLQSYTVFDSEIYKPLRDRKPFLDYIEKVKRRNGIGLPAPSFRRESIAGHSVALEKNRGKVVLLDFWATFCGPCLEEMPNLKKLYDRYREKGFEIIAFSEDQDQSRLASYLKDKGISWENVLCPKAEADETVRLYRVVNIPASFLIDQNGIVRHVNLSGQDLEKAIEELLTRREESKTRRF